MSDWQLQDAKALLQRMLPNVTFKNGPRRRNPSP